jgi:hypothetical protein
VQSAARLERLGRRILPHVIDSLLGVFLLGIVFGFVVVRGGLGSSYLKEGLGAKKANNEQKAEGRKHNATTLRA